MVRKNNKGFSLIEVIVAVAILTLLMAPIIQQVIQTLNTSAQAKERQYAVENAEYILNYMQETPVSKLDSLSKDLGAVPVDDEDGISIDGGSLKFTGYEKKTMNANFWIVKPESGKEDEHDSEAWASQELYLSRAEISDGQINSALEGSVGYSYNATLFTLANDSMGRKDNVYRRKVIVDNLRAVVASKMCTIETSFSSKAIDVLKSKDFTITSEGAAVRTDDDGFVTDIIVSKVKGMRSPNGTGTSYMQDLDSSKVAIIQGSASNFDQQAENDLYNLKMSLLKKYNAGAWTDAMLTKDPYGNVLDTSRYFNDNVSKMTRVSIVSGYDTNRELKYYDVSCTVFYEDYLIKNGSYTEESASADSDAATGAADEITDKELNALIAKPQVLTYNAYSKRFYTSQAPDIYLVYEPYVARGLNYANKDYITTYDGVIYGDNEKHSKLYIIKPNQGRVVKYTLLSAKPSDWSFNYTHYYELENKVDENDEDVYVPVKLQEEEPEFKENTYYARSNNYATSLTSNTDQPVKVYLNYISIKNPSSTSEEESEETGETEEEDTDEEETEVVTPVVTPQIPIYTNISKTVFVNELPEDVKDGVQYSDNQDLYYGVVKSVKAGFTDNDATYKANELERLAYAASNLHDIGEDVTQSDRVYTVTVQLDKLRKDKTVYSGYSVRLSGAKGAE